ncbi:hypothetical protein [Erythrobacter mangrovi]|uniref:Uncharacterized protein n=1 Tax=Erythrobacter mangrovi TaxID=2739433 RepID=A0A7D4BSM4_9SPHN|nr:hypothetical protein [Erythrobacter mangrovi]QKG70067.1 hypothetical protein HQR01_01030 [Erythrobacter mangrovi]
MATPASAESIPPRDECGDIPGADAFRMTLATAVANRNEAMLVPLFAPNVKFHDDFGHAALRERLPHPDYRLWEELDALLQLGCGGTANELYVPWVGDQGFVMENPSVELLAVGSAIPLRSAPSETALVLRYLNWEVVRWNSEWETTMAHDFAQVTIGSMVGYVLESQLRSEFHYHMSVSRIDGRWQVTSLVDGE